MGHYDNISDPNDSRQAGQNFKKSYISKPKDDIVILKIFLEYNHRGGKRLISFKVPIKPSLMYRFIVVLEKRIF